MNFRARRFSNNRVHYLPHQHVKNKQKSVAQAVKSRNALSGMLTILSNDKEKVVGNSNLIKSKMINAESNQNVKDIDSMRGKVVDYNNKNMLLFGQYSPTTALLTTTTSTSTVTTNTTSKKTTERNCIVCSPNGLTTTAALTMNLSSIGPLCTNIGCMGAAASTSSGSLEANSRMSRSASPALGAAGENNNSRSLLIGDFLFIKKFVVVFYSLIIDKTTQNIIILIHQFLTSLCIHTKRMYLEIMNNLLRGISICARAFFCS